MVNQVPLLTEPAHLVTSWEEMRLLKLRQALAEALSLLSIPSTLITNRGNMRLINCQFVVSVPTSSICRLTASTAPSVTKTHLQRVTTRLL